MPRTRAHAKKEADISSVSPVFTLFPNLPVEIRFQIWDLACQEQRVIGLWGSYVDPDWAHEESMAIQREHALFPGKLKVQRFNPPSVLHVSREARTVGLKQYTLAFGTVEGSEYQVNEKGVHEPFIYVNWKFDIFFPTSDDAACGFVTKTTHARYRVAMNQDSTDMFDPSLWIGGHQYLEEVIIVVLMGNPTFPSIIRRLRSSRPIDFQIQTPSESELEQSLSDDVFEELNSRVELALIGITWYPTIAQTIKIDGAKDPEAWKVAHTAAYTAKYGKPLKMTKGLMKVN